MNDNDTIRRAVARAYGQAVSSERATCCGEAPKGIAVRTAGYSKQQWESLPAGSAINSFGCGNPIAFAEVRENDTVVDLGAGAGVDIILAARQVGPGGRVIGIDMTDEMIERARQSITESGLTNVEVRKGLIEAMPVSSASVDWVISNCVINLSPEKDRVFAEIARVLKPGGQMLVSDIVVDSKPTELTRSGDFACSCVAGAVSEAEYCEGLRKAGVTNVEIRARHNYSAAQIEAIARSDLESVADAAISAADNQLPCAVSDVATLMEGLVASVYIYAQKPVA